MTMTMTQNVINRLLFLLALVFFSLLIGHHYLLVTTPVPLDIFEPAVSVITQYLVDGGNLYSFEAQPVFTSFYTPLVNHVMAAVSPVTGTSLLAHRFLSALCIIGCCVVCYRSAVVEGCSRAYATAGVVILYAVLLFYNTPIAGGSAIGLLGFLLCICIPRWSGFNASSLVLSAVAGVAAFYGKQYFLAGPAFVALGLAFFVGFRTAFLYSTGFAALLVATIVVSVYFGPYFLDNVLFATGSAALGLSSFAVVFVQLRDYFWIYSGFLVGSSLFIPALMSKDKKEWSSWYWLMFTLSTLLIIFTIGKNPGNYLTYLFQMMTPFLVIAFMTDLSRNGGIAIFHLPIVAVVMLQSWLVLEKDFEVEPEQLKKIEKIIQANETILAPPMLAHIILQNDKQLIDGPQSRWAHHAKHKPAFLIRENRENRIETITARHADKINDMLDNKAFDMILIHGTVFGYDYGMITAEGGSWPAAYTSAEQRLQSSYRIEQTLKLKLPDRRGAGPQTIQVWKPLKNQ